MRTRPVEFQAPDCTGHSVKVSWLVACLNVPEDHLAIRRTCGEVVKVRVPLDGFYVIQVATLAAENPQRRTIFHYPEFGGSISWTRSKIATQRTKLDFPNRKTVPIINHKRSFSLQAPPSDSVIIRSTQQMLVANGNRHSKDRTRVPHKIILLSVFDLTLQISINLNLGRIFALFCRFALAPWNLLPRLVPSLFSLLTIFIELLRSECIFDLLSNHMVDCEDVVHLYTEDVDFDCAAGETASHNSPRIWHRRTVNLSACV